MATLPATRLSDEADNPGMSALIEEARPDAADTAPALDWEHAFAALGPAFHTELQPSPLPSPVLVGGNARLAAELGLPDS